MSSPFSWTITSPTNVIYTNAESQQIQDAVQAFRRSLPHHRQVALNVAVGNDDGSFVEHHWTYVSPPQGEEVGV